MDKKAKKAGIHFNVIDVILIIAIIAAAAVISYVMLSGRFDNAAPNTEREIQYSVLLTGVRGEFRDNIEIGNKVTDTVKLMAIGEVIDVKAVESIKQYENESTGEVIDATIPDTYDITVIIKATADVSSGYYMIGGYKMSVGTLVSLRVPNFTSTGYCLSIEEVAA